MADLRLDQREAAVAAKAVVPGKPAESSLIERILSTDPDTLMPPPNSNRKLSDAQRALLQRWVTEGAVYEDHWAFVKPVRPALPTVKQEAWVRNPIDRFVLSRLESTGLTPAPEADRATLIKRLSIDLIGLPPTPSEIDAFVNDPDPQAYEHLVERLFNSPHYGERMALPWLDTARYADSNGFQQDGDTWQWIWRDWVVKSFNEDLPFDKFTVWQLAGDLLPDATEEQKIASAFNRNHLLNGEGGAIPEEQRFVILFDRIDTTSTTWLGLTMACAQCHDHKYDPMTMRDYYRLLDAFNRVPETGTPQFFSKRVRVAPPFIELPTEENKAKIAELEAKIKSLEADGKLATDAAYEGWLTAFGNEAKIATDVGDLSEPLKQLLTKPADQRSDDEKKTVEKDLRKYFNDKVRSKIAGKIPAMAQLEDARKALNEYRNDQVPRVMIMSDEKPRESAILDRGEYLKPTEKVSFAPPEFLPPLPEGAPANRLGLAQWLVSPEHPLTARVQANRMWQHFFGIGIIKTAEDFGVQSEYPQHKDLLDWLAVEFRENGWSMKALQRTIVLSNTYRQSSRVSPESLARDPENRMYGRASRFRMPSLLLRDWALATAGLLEPKLFGKPVYPYQPDDVWEALAITKERDFTYPTSSGKDLYRRSLYTFWRRTVSPANMFDASNRQTCRVRTSVTSTPLHALTTLNDPTWVEAARVLAEAATKQAGNDLSTQLQWIAKRVLCRELRADELAILQKSFEKQQAIYREDPAAAEQLLKVGAAPREAAIDATNHAALTQVCLGVLNLDEALTRE